MGLLLTTAVLTAGCNNDDKHIANEKLVNVEMACAFSSYKNSSLSRMTSDVITSDETNPRLPRFTHIIPLINNDPANIDVSWKEPVNKENPNSRFYCSNFCNLSVGVNGFLVYGSVANKPATATASVKMYNGSLIEDFPEPVFPIR